MATIPVGSEVELLNSEKIRGTVAVVFPARMLDKEEIYQVRTSPHKAGQYRRSELCVIYPNRF